VVNAVSAAVPRGMLVVALAVTTMLEEANEGLVPVAVGPTSVVLPE